MANALTNQAGLVKAIWRYPVKSMLGEEVNGTIVTERGLLGDRAYALVDQETGKIVSAKNPKKWGELFACRATLPASANEAGTIPAAAITFPDGRSARSTEPDIDERLSRLFNRPVKLNASAPDAAKAECYWPDYNWLEAPDSVCDFELPAGTFFDCATIHLVTTATLARLAELAPESRMDVRRFRPNFVVDCAGSATGFIENDWAGRTLSIGSEVRMMVTAPTVRCVMTTLCQEDIPKDPHVLRTAVQKNRGAVGIYARVVRGGTVQRGDIVTVE